MPYGIGTYIKEHASEAAILINPLLGIQAVLGGKEVEEKVIEPQREAQRAEEEALQAARNFQKAQAESLENQRLRNARQLRLTMAQRARDKRVAMASTIAGQEVGIMNSTPIAGPDLSKNKIPTLDPIDNMGNTIPEV